MAGTIKSQVDFSNRGAPNVEYAPQEKETFGYDVVWVGEAEAGDAVNMDTGVIEHGMTNESVYGLPSFGDKFGADLV